MNINELILPLLLMIGVFAFSLYIKKANINYQMIIAGVAVAYSLVACFVTTERSFLFITVLGISWLAKLYKQKVSIARH